ncbi:hypothetical protein Q5752_001457 [Cryptotrichosporon argae]
MSPHRQLSHSSSRRPRELQDIFLGLAFTLASPESAGADGGRDLEYTAVLHDGTGVVESETMHLTYRPKDGSDKALAEESKRIAMEVIHVIRHTQDNKGMNVRLVAIAEPVPDELRNKSGVEFPATCWLHLDAIPFITTPATAIFTKLPAPSTAASATSAVASAIRHLHPATHSATTADVDPADNRVLVDCDGQVKLCNITQYRESTSDALWRRFSALADHIKHHKVKISFFSATPQGGGVALMRHAMIRLFRLVGVEAQWYVPTAHNLVFDITKRKFHNVLQGVAPKGVELENIDKQWFELWTQQNYESFWAKGAIDAHVIVIDDPQPAALIPIIRRDNPKAKIIFRSHIQIQSDLTDDPSTPQARTWDYLFSFIKDVDLFLAHPVKFFVPKNVHENLPVLYMAPSTDPLDGLNKPYGLASTHYFRQYFNSLSAKQCGVTIDWDRGYVCQIARFDPSKGIDVLLAAYLSFRKQLGDEKGSKPPQLIIMGHGSVDDPDGTMVYEQCHDTLASREYALVKDDVAVVRAPPSDSILGCILQGAWVATQLSTREGFEVKVTEAINKRVPIIASDAGGIPLQVKHGVNGWVVPAGDAEAVAAVLLDVARGKAAVHRELISGRKLATDKTDPNSVAEQFVRHFESALPKVHADSGATSEDFWTVGNSARWLLLFSRVLGLDTAHAAADGKAGDKADDKADHAALLEGMHAGKRLEGKAVDGENVWRMLMANDMLDDEGALR